VRCLILDKSNGLISNFVNLQNIFSLPQGVYGIEFSNNDNLLYLSAFWGTSRLYQINLSNMSILTISSIAGNYNYGFLQMAPNNKIYMGRNNQSYLSVINNPDLIGVTCDFQNIGINLLPGTRSNIGLHNMSPSSFFPASNSNSTLVSDTTLCDGSSLNLHLISKSDCVSSLTWSNSQTSDTINVSSSGIYWVDINNGCLSYRDSIIVDILNPPIVTLIDDTVLCNSTPFELNSSIIDADLLWSDGSTSNSITISSDSIYWLQASNLCGISSDTVKITTLNTPNIFLGNDTILCNNTTIELNAYFPGLSYLWNDNSTDSVLQVSQSGLYWVEVSNSNCSFRDSINITIISPLELNLGNDTTLCENTPLTLTSNLNGLSYLWQDNSTGNSLDVNTGGLYWLEVSSGNCSSRDSVNVTFLTSPNVFLGNDTILCNNTMELDAYSPGLSYLWNDNSTDSVLQVSQSGLYWVEVSNSNCSFRDSITITIIPPLDLNLGNDTTLCENTPLTLTSNLNGLSYLWQDNSTGNSLEVNSGGLYWLEVSDGNCTSRDSLNVTFLASPTVSLGNDTILCNNTMELDAYSPGLSYLWNDNSTDSVLQVSQSGLYWVEVSNSACEVFDTITINAYIPISIVLDTTVCESESLILRPNIIGNSYRWSDFSTLPFLAVDQRGQYIVEVYNNCGTDTVKYNVDFVFCNCSVYIPNTFTPDGNEINQLFKVEYSCDLEYFRILIFNRWGEIIFESYDPDYAWDATYRGRLVQDGTYVYKVFYQFDGEMAILSKAGHVNIIK
jgi:gliding motility-associated-like protein